MMERRPPRPEQPLRPTVAMALEILLVAAGLTLIVSYRFFVPIWQVGSGLLALGLLTSAAYLAARFAPGGSERVGPGRAIVLALIVSQPVLALLWILDLNVSRPVLMGELGLLFVGIWASSSRIGAPVRAAVAIGFAGLAAVPTLLGIARPADDRLALVGPTQEYLFSSYHDLSVTTYSVEDDGQEGGALTLLADGRVLLITGGGLGYILDFADGLDTSVIELGLPIDVAGYRALGRREPQFYRVFDAVLHDGRLFVSHVHWDAEKDCYSIRLLESEFDPPTVGPWTTRFSSRPCLPLAHTPNTSGGRIGVLDGSHLLLTLGTFTTEGENLDPEASDYGKIIELDTETWTPEVFTTGHRNPEGLLVVGDSIWSTEHGPHGGDELNLIEAGSNYGWPFVSYGTDYGKKTLRDSDPGDHSNFVPPIHAWTPSVGISNLIRVSDGLFPMWRGDLLIGSLSGLGNGHSLFRVRLLDGRAVNIERLSIESRVRDLIQLPDGGPVVVWSGRGEILVVEPADLVFSQCAGCHGIRNAQHGIGPDLFGVVGSPVGRHPEYDYSEGLKDYGGAWTPDRLDRFLASPQSEVPGTSMDLEGIADPSERAEIIQFLSEISAGRYAR